VGVSPELLRAWERRYGLLRPVRSAGGFRLYSDEDAERVSRMRQGLAEGLSAAEAARAALESEPAAGPLLEDAADRLLAAIRLYDEGAAHRVLDEALAAYGLEPLVRDLILPTLQHLGREWDKDRLGISHEHFASNLIRGRLLSLSRLWASGGGPAALLGCPPGEEHDISLLAFGVLLHSRGWRIVFLGADTPIATLGDTAAAAGAALTVLASFDQSRIEHEAAALRRLARRVPLALGGPGASEQLCRRIGGRWLEGDLVTAAADVAADPSSFTQTG
jgi:MerR family transcriptional regulator, light-induced transcriptional regulator